MKNENNNLRIALRDGISIGVGYLAASFAFGISATSAGLSVWQAVLVSLLNLTSAGQLAAVPILAAQGSLLELALTQLVINSRYSLMSVSLSQRFADSVRFRDRFWIGFGNTDEIFAVASSGNEPRGRRYFLCLIIPAVIGWVLGTALGATSGELLPTIVVTALSVAIYAMFIAIVVPVAKCHLGTLLCVLAAAVCSSLFHYLPLLSGLPSGFVIVILAVVISALFALLFPISPEGEEGV